MLLVFSDCALRSAADGPWREFATFDCLCARPRLLRMICEPFANYNLDKATSLRLVLGRWEIMDNSCLKIRIAREWPQKLQATCQGPALFLISALEWQAWYYANSKDKAMLTSCLKGNTGPQACKCASLYLLDNVHCDMKCYADRKFG